MALSKTDIIKNSIINSMRNASELAVQQAKYDKTILATIQYCTDVTLQQYKIKYQDGYYTAYGDPSSGKTYAKNTAVYVVVPENNLAGKLRITGTASDDNSNLISTSAMVKNQQYKTATSSFLIPIDKETGGKVTFCTDQVGTDYTTYVFQNELAEKGEEGNLYDIQSKTSSQQQESYSTRRTKICNEIRNSGIKYIQIGAKFKTNMPEEQKIGNYGICVELKYDGEAENVKLSLDTFDMDGAPFDFNEYMTKTQWFEIDPAKFLYIDKVYTFAKGFDTPAEDPRPIDTEDICIKEITVIGGYKLYDYNDSGLRIDVQEVNGKSLTFDPYNIETKNAERNFSATLLLQGNPVDETLQSVNFYWGVRDSSVDSVGNPYYQEELGQGWRCVNNYTITKTKDGLSYADISLHNYNGFLDVDTNNVYEIKRLPTNVITFKKEFCKGKTTEFKCAAKYEGNIITSEIKALTNPDGGYIVLYASETNFSGGKGNFTVVANTFYDWHLPDQPNETRNERIRKKYDDNQIHYVWSYRDSASDVSIPDTSLNRYLSSAEWDSRYDNVTKTAEEVEAYLDGRDDLACCRERYSYYKNFYDRNKTNESVASSQIQRAKLRYLAAASLRTSILDKSFVEDNDNLTNSEILGMATIKLKADEEYREGAEPTIDHIEYHYYEQGQPLPQDIKQRNTLYKVQASSIQGANRTYTVSAFLKTEDEQHNISYVFLETKSIVIVSSEASSLKYDVEIIGGNQAFIYDESGRSPASKKATAPITIQPLFFKLRETATGKILYDSSKEDDTTGEASVNVLTATDLSPVWYFPDAANSMLTTLYLPQEGSNECYYDENEKLNALTNQKQFNFGLAETYKPELKDKNEIRLLVKFNEITNENNETVLVKGDQQVYRATTHFNFAKEGELGTNGTNMYLDIVDLAYEQYKEDVLSDYDEIPIKTNGREEIKQVCPNARFLRDTYLFATQSYSNLPNNEEQPAPMNGSTLGDNAKYVNLYFGRNINDDTVALDSTAVVDAFWYEGGTQKSVSNKCKWGTQITQEITRTADQAKVMFKPSFRLSTEAGSSRNTLSVEYCSDRPPYGYRPTGSIFQSGGQDYKRIASNIISCSDYEVISGQFNEITNQAVERENFGFFAVPYFYYHSYDNDTGEPINLNLDPARYIYITGGFSEVYYKDDGSNPTYNKDPFRVTVFDASEDKKDISNLFTFTWEVSPGLTAEPKITNPNNISNYSDVDTDEDLQSKLVKYNGHFYRCLKENHTRGHGTITASDGTTYDPGDFVRPYYEAVDESVYNGRECTITPADKYATQITNSLFNSYVIIKGTTEGKNTPDGNVYEIEVMLPITIYLNKYGSKIINGWNGQTTKVGDQYILSPQIAAGYKNEDNSFVGITIGTNMYDYKSNTTKHPETGIFGYGNTKGQSVTQTSNWGRTLFIDAHTGRAIFGASGAGQIILDPTLSSKGGPRDNEKNIQNWSRLGGWYFNSNYLYKPIGEYDDNTKDFSYYSQGGPIKPPSVGNDPGDLPGSIGIYCPGQTPPLSGDKFIWASAKMDLANDKDAQYCIKEMNYYKGLMSNDPYLVTFNDAGKPTNFEERIVYFNTEYRKGVTKEQLILDYKDDKQIDSPDIHIIIEDGIEYYQFKDYGKVLLGDWHTIKITIDNNVQTIMDTEHISEEAAFAKSCDNERAIIVDAYRHDNEYINNLNEWKHLYDDLKEEYKVYEDMATASEAVVDYKTATNSTKPNFYVTYGGRVHCNAAEVTGKITATSGTFGTRNNKIEINVFKEQDSDLGAGRYVFWNKNFKMKDEDGRNGAAMMVRGCIMAESGQIGNVKRSADGKSSNTVFIEYDWYPWRLPQNRMEGEVPAPEPGAKIGHGEPWTNEFFYLQEERGRTEKYALYHKNFYIKNNGDVVLNGLIYSKSGRIGDWIIDGSILRSATDNHKAPGTDFIGMDGIILNPGKITVAYDENGKPYAEECHPEQSYIWVGTTQIRGDGYIGGWKFVSETTKEPTWYIDKNGNAKINSANNDFGGFKVDIYGNPNGSREISNNRSGSNDAPSNYGKLDATGLELGDCQLKYNHGTMDLRSSADNQVINFTVSGAISAGRGLNVSGNISGAAFEGTSFTAEGGSPYVKVEGSGGTFIQINAGSITGYKDGIDGLSIGASGDARFDGTVDIHELNLRPGAAFWNEIQRMAREYAYGAVEEAMNRWRSGIHLETIVDGRDTSVVHYRILAANDSDF